MFGGLFGGGGQGAPRPAYQQQYAPPPQPVYQQGGYQPGMFQSGGSGFLGSALTTAAGVAGGVLAADAISSMFSPHGYGGGFGGGGFGGGMGGGGWGGGGEVINETTVNNYGDAGGGAGGGADPWSGRARRTRKAGIRARRRMPVVAAETGAAAVVMPAVVAVIGAVAAAVMPAGTISGGGSDNGF